VGPSILVSLAIIATVAWFTRHRSLPPAEIKLRQLTFNSVENPVTTAAISPDGKYVAYTDSKGIHVRLMETGDTRLVPEPEAFKSVSPDWDVVSPWFPDSTRFLVNASPAGTGIELSTREESIWVVSVLGGPPRKLRDYASAYGVSPDGSTIAFATSEDSKVDLWLMGIDGENARKLYESDEINKLGDLTWFPHGQRVAYTIRDQSGVRLVTRSLAGGPVTTILSQSEMSEVNDFTIVPGARLLYVLSDPESVNTCNYWSVDIDEQTGSRIGNPKRLTNWGGNCMNNITATADGKKLAFVKFLTQYQLNVADMVPDGTKVSKVHPLDMTESRDIPMDWSADSKHLILKSNRNPHSGIYKQALDESTAEQLVTSPNDLYMGQVTPDGLWVVYAEAKRNDDLAPVKVMRVPIAGGPSQFVLEARPPGWPSCAKSPGKRCLFSEYDEARKVLIFTAFDPLKGRGLELARIDFPNYPYFSYSQSPDGDRIAYATGSEGPVHILSLRGQPPLQVKVTDLKNFLDVDWAGNGKALLVKLSVPGGTVLKYVDLHGNAHVLWQQHQGQVMNGRTSPDGRHLAWAIETVNENLWIMENF
jgi:eukaryotic-like serine/threonine-protein kinase